MRLKEFMASIVMSVLISISATGCTDNYQTSSNDGFSNTDSSLDEETTSSSSSNDMFTSDFTNTYSQTSSDSSFSDIPTVKVGQYNMYEKGTTYYDGYVYYGNGNLCRRPVTKKGVGEKEILVRDSYIYKVLFVIDDEVYFSRIYRKDPRALMKCKIDGSDVVTIMDSYDCQYWVDEQQEIYGLLQWTKESPKTDSDGKITTTYTAKAKIIKVDRKNNTWDDVSYLENNIYYYFHGNTDGKIYFEKRDVDKADYSYDYYDYGDNLGLFEFDISTKKERQIASNSFLGAAIRNNKICFFYTKENGQKNELHQFSLDGTDTIIISTPNKFEPHFVGFSSIDMHNPPYDFFFSNDKIYAQFKDDLNNGFLYDVTDGTMNYVCNVDGEWGFFNPFSNSICYIPFEYN